MDARHRPAQSDQNANGGQEQNHPQVDVAMEENSLDCELMAAIEYKIAAAGMDGITHILDIVSEAVRRRAVEMIEFGTGGADASVYISRSPRNEV